MSVPWSRRSFLRLSGNTALVTGIPSASIFPTAGAASGAGDEFDRLRDKWREMLLGSGFDPAAAPFAAKLALLGSQGAEQRAAMAATAGSLWPDLPLTLSASITATYARLGTMAQAYAQPGAQRFGLGRDRPRPAARTRLGGEVLRPVPPQRPDEDAVSGRATSRGTARTGPHGFQGGDHGRGHGILASVALLGTAASSAEQRRWRGLVKGWAQRDHYSPVLSDTDLGVAALARAHGLQADGLLRDGQRGEPPRLARRGGHAPVVGDTYGNGQYTDAFWPTVDPYRLPGPPSRRSRSPTPRGVPGACRDRT